VIKYKFIFFKRRPCFCRTGKHNLPIKRSCRKAASYRGKCLFSQFFTSGPV